jgi:2-amino-4-hydroxy-6-hydroxymethyldihydropteridine diphosphokinase
MAQALIGLGSNIEPRRGYLKLAVAELGRPPMRLLALSPLYETEPMDVTDQASFLNMAAMVETDLGPQALLGRLQQIEALAHKKVELRRGPRTLDLDLWSCGEAVLESDELTLPHPRMSQRPFVLLPLAEIAPEWRHPLTKLNAGEMLRRLPKPWPAVTLLGPL